MPCEAQLLLCYFSYTPKGVCCWEIKILYCILYCTWSLHRVTLSTLYTSGWTPNSQTFIIKDSQNVLYWSLIRILTVSHFYTLHQNKFPLKQLQLYTVYIGKITALFCPRFPAQNWGGGGGGGDLSRCRLPPVIPPRPMCATIRVHPSRLRLTQQSLKWVGHEGETMPNSRTKASTLP